MRRTHQALFVGVAIALAGVTAPADAQQPAPVTTRSYAQLVRLRPEMVNEWLALQKDEVIPAQKKAGVTNRTTLVTVVGNAFEYLILTPFPTWAGFDDQAPLVRALGADAAAQLNAKLRKCVMTQQSYMVNRVDSLSIPASDAPVWRVSVRRAIPGKLQDFLSYYKTEVLPGMQKAKGDGKIAGSSVAIRGAGALSGEFTTVTYYPNFASLDAGDPLVQALGRDAADRINAKAAQFATSNQVIIRRRMADLSF